MNESQQGRVALVTGGARGLGVEVCRQLAQAGMTVLLTARDEERAAAVAAELAGDGDVRAARLDIDDAEDIAPHLRASGHGRLVNVSSGAGSITDMRSGHTPAYSTAKLALNGLTRMLAAELHEDGVLVNSVCPGWTATDMGGGGRPVAEGARSVTWACLLDDDGPTAGFFRDGREIAW